LSFHDGTDIRLRGGIGYGEGMKIKMKMKRGLKEGGWRVK
jgi:hypothetical protein